MARVAKALVAIFTAIVLGLLAMFWLAKYRLEHARFTEEIAVVVAAPGFSVSDAERSIAEPLEDAINQVKGVESIRTVVHPSHVVITAAVTVIGMDAQPPVALVHEALSRTQSSLPQEIDPPYVHRMDTDPTMRRFVARSDTLTRLELSRWLDEVLRRKLEVQPGVKEVRLCGAVEPELKITLDLDRLRSYGLSVEAVLDAVRNSSVHLPGGRVTAERFVLRMDKGSLEDLERLELRGPEVRLADVARLEQGSTEGECSSLSDVVISVRTWPETELVVPSHPAIALTPFTPKRTARFLSPPGTSMRQAMQALGQQAPNAVITAERDELTVMFAEEPQRLPEVPGLALRAMDDRHSVVQVSGPAFDELVTLAGKARERLVKEQARWVGATWPGLGPEQVIKPVRGVKGLAELLQLALGGVNVGRLDDRTDVRVYAGVSGVEELGHLVLADGRRASEVLEISQTLAPAAMLRVNRQRTVELEVGLEPAEVRRLVSELSLPQGYSLSVMER